MNQNFIIAICFADIRYLKVKKEYGYQKSIATFIRYTQIQKIGNPQKFRSPSEQENQRV
jgi:hypothetical protein